MVNEYKKIHFVGIGGIGVSAAARLMLSRGIKVSGSDKSDSVIVDDLKKKGAKIVIGEHKAKNIPKGTEAIVYSVAAKENPETKHGKKKKIPTFTYPEFVKKISNGKSLICIAGTHGKSTTTALAGLLLYKSGLDPTIVVGSNVDYLKGNARFGKSDYFVLEADEYRQAFINYKPKIAIVTSIDFDHPDCYENLDKVKKAFHHFLKGVPKDGVIIANRDDKNVFEVVSVIKKKIIWYGIESKKYDLKAKNIKADGKVSFDVDSSYGHLKNINLLIFGKHNVQNSLAVILLGQYLGISENKIKKALSSYHGAWRRFEIKAKKNGITVIDDYAHHPTEIKALLDAARMKYPGKRIITLFQPHHQERTKSLFHDFAPALKKSDLIILTDVYKVPGRVVNMKLDIEEIVGELALLNAKAYYVEKINNIPKMLKKIITKGDIILVVGAGDINTITEEIVKLI